MKIENRDIKELKMSTYNPRLDLQPDDKEYRDIKNSIVEFNLVEPLVINKDLTVIGGHQRLKVLKELDFKTVPCVIVDLDKKKEKILNIALNKISGDWDRPKLKDLLEELDTGEFDISLTGFDDSEIEDLMTEFHESEEDDFDVDKAVEEVGEPVCKRGDIWQLGKHRLMCGDATVKEDVKKLMDGKKADMVLTDPPYGINLIKGELNGIGGGKLCFTHGKLSPKQRKVDKKLYRKIEGDDKPFDPTFLIPLSKKVFIFGANNFSDKLPPSPHWLVWDKKNEGEERRTTFSDAELIWTSIRGIAVKIYRWHWSGVTRKGNRVDELITRCHPAQKPVGLLAEIVSDYTKPGELIIDLFGGSGSTLISCEKTNRKCYMMEIDPIYCDVIIKRWEQHTNKKAVLL